MLRIKNEFPSIADGVAVSAALSGVHAEADAVFAAPGLRCEGVLGRDPSERAAPPEVGVLEREWQRAGVVEEQQVAAVGAEDQEIGAAAVRDYDER